MTATNNWKNIWDKKGDQILSMNDPALTDMIREDGFDSGAGDHTTESWLELAGMVYGKLGINTATRVLEVGCGCGAFVYPAYRQGVPVGGVDYSRQLVAGAGKAMPEGVFLQAEASRLPFRDGQFNVVFCHSVFQYFPSAEYAQQAIKEMVRMLAGGNGAIGVLDINDAEREELFYQVRGESIGKEKYAEKYRDYPHRFYLKSWFDDIFRAAGFQVEIVDQDIENYGNSAFRFNVFASCAAG